MQLFRNGCQRPLFSHIPVSNECLKCLFAFALLTFPRLISPFWHCPPLLYWQPILLSQRAVYNSPSCFQAPPA
ncbi:hypothetical protein 2016_scaffold57_00104 [Bacteriophage sp.]|nr:hypothetical protein 2016_scaffold57_00104 [Bacteriophage sp.]